MSEGEMAAFLVNPYILIQYLSSEASFASLFIFVTLIWNISETALKASRFHKVLQRGSKL